MDTALAFFLLLGLVGVRGWSLPIYRHFYVERRGADGWVVPQGFEAEPWTFEYDRPFGGFAWAHPCRGWLDLFWGARALFPMRAGAPDDRQGSALLKYLDQFYDYELNEDDLCWLPYTDLLADCWDTDRLILGAKIPARYALLFGDGKHPFPNAELLEAGLSSTELQRLDDVRLAKNPVDIAFGRERFRLADLPPHYEVEVTWSATIAEFIGEPHARLFRELRRYGPDEELRLLSRRG